MPAILYYKKNSEISHSDISESSLRFLANLFFFILLICLVKYKTYKLLIFNILFILQRK
jgi:hypothetical protein